MWKNNGGSRDAYSYNILEEGTLPTFQNMSITIPRPRQSTYLAKYKEQTEEIRFMGYQAYKESWAAVLAREKLATGSKSFDIIM